MSSSLAIFSFPAAVVRHQSRLTTDDAVGGADEPLELPKGVNDQLIHIITLG